MGKISLEHKERTVNEKNDFENVGDLMGFIEILGEMIRWKSMSTRLN